MSHSIPLHSLVMRSEVADTATHLGAPSRPAALSGEPRIGDRLGPYYLQELVGEGGMGRVFRAVHEKLGRQVAIKLLRRSSSFGAGVTRFLREARVVNRVRHPGLIEITDIVEAPPGGDSYYVMEWLEGKNLHQRMVERGGRLAAGEYLAVLIEVAAALEAVHQAGLVHRDLKPENIYLVSGGPGEPERIKVIDFGVALDLQDPGALQEDDIVGTPAYVAPEQARGEAVDGRTDIYSMGVVLYELAVGRLPFEAKTALDSLAKRLEGGPPRPRKAAPRGVEVPRPLEHVILRAMETHADRRYEDMTALRDELIALRQHLLLPRWQRGLWGMASIAVPVTLIGAAAGVLWSERDALQGRTRGLIQHLSARLHPALPAGPPPPPEVAEPLLLEVKVQTSPAGAEVRHAGAVLGTTPCIVRLPEGLQEVELRRSGYRRERRSLDVRVGGQLTVRLQR